jgi:hypothetical protein
MICVQPPMIQTRRSAAQSRQGGGSAFRSRSAITASPRPSREIRLMDMVDNLVGGMIT